MFLFDPSSFSIYTRYIPVPYFVLIIYCLTFTGGPWLQDRFPGYYVHSCCSWIYSSWYFKGNFVLKLWNMKIDNKMFDAILCPVNVPNMIEQALCKDFFKK